MLSQILTKEQDRLLAEERRLLSDLRVTLARLDVATEDQSTLEQSIHQQQGDAAAGAGTAHRLLFRRRHRLVHPLPPPEEESERPSEELAQQLQEDGARVAQAALEVRLLELRSQYAVPDEDRVPYVQWPPG